MKRTREFASRKTQRAMTPELRQRYHQRLVELRARVQRDADYITNAIQETTAPVESPFAPAAQTEESVDGLIEADSSILEAEGQVRDEIDAALAKFETGSFGYCEACGQEIGKARLDAMPYARVCIKCAKERDMTP